MKLVFLLPALFILEISVAQTTYQFSTGANYGELRSKINGQKDNGTKPAIGFIESGSANFTVAKKLVIQTGLQYESINMKINTTNYDTAGGIKKVDVISAKTHVNYLNFPVTAWWVPDSRKGFRIGAGTNFGFGIGGKSNTTDVATTTFNGNTTTNVSYASNKIKFGHDEGELQSMYISLYLNAAYLISNKFLVGVYLNFGTNNVSNIDGVLSRVESSGLTLGYSFGGSKRK